MCEQEQEQYLETERIFCIFTWALFHLELILIGPDAKKERPPNPWRQNSFLPATFFLFFTSHFSNLTVPCDWALASEIIYVRTEMRRENWGVFNPDTWSVACSCINLSRFHSWTPKKKKQNGNFFIALRNSTHFVLSLSSHVVENEIVIGLSLLSVLKTWKKN